MNSTRADYAGLIKSRFGRFYETQCPGKIVYGSAAKGHLLPGHDIDTFLCVSDWTDQEQEQLIAWLVDLHRELNLEIDIQEPFEVVSIDELWLRQHYAEKLRIRRTVRSYYAYETIVWMDLLSGPKLAPVGDLELLALFVHRAQARLALWRGEIALLSGSPIDENIDFTSLCEERLCYEESGRNDPSIAKLLGDIVE